MDELTYKKYESLFLERKENTQKQQNEKGNDENINLVLNLLDKVPDDWLKGSKSFFERRKEEQERKRMLEQEKSSSKS